MSQDLYKNIPTQKPSVSQAEIDAATKVIQSGWWGTGQVTQQLEKNFANFIGVKHAIAVNSGTAALHLSLAVLDPKPGQNIITTPLTFLSTGLVGLYFDLEVRLADIDPNTLCMDSKKADALADDQTIAIIPVHYAGRLANMNYAGQTPIIEDAAHAVGTPGAGHTGLISCWSFHPVKNIATGNGGMLTTNDDSLASRLNSLRWLGINSDAWSRFNKAAKWDIQALEVGYKYNPNDIMSAIALTQLKRIEKLNQRRKTIANYYQKNLSTLPITLPPKSGSWHLYAIQLPPHTRPQFIEYLHQHHISLGIHYKPLNHFPLFNNSQKLEVIESIWPNLVDLPIFPDLTKKQQDCIIATIHQFFKQKPKHQKPKNHIFDSSSPNSGSINI